MRDTTADLTPTATPTPPAQRSASSLHLSRRSSQALAGADSREPSTPREPRLSRRTSVNSNATDATSSHPYRSSLLASRRSSTGPSILGLRHQTISPTRSPLNESTMTPDSFPPAPSRSISDGPKSPSMRSPRKRNHGVDDMTRMLDDLIRQKVEEQDREKQNGAASAPSPEGRSNSLNLMAMRNSPLTREKRAPRLSNASEGLGIRSSSEQQQRNADAAAPVRAASKTGRRRTSVIREKQINALKGKASKEETEPAQTNGTFLDSDPAAPSSSSLPNGNSLSHRSSAMPAALRTKATTPSTSSRSRATSISNRVTSTNAAAQATNALRGGQAQYAPDTADDSEADGEGMDTMASSTVGAPSVWGEGSTVRTDDDEPVPALPSGVTVGQSPSAVP